MATALEATKKDLAGAESAYKGLVETTRDGVYVARPDGQVMYANSTLSVLLDEPGADLTGRNARYLFPVAGAPKKAYNDALRPGRHRIVADLPSGRNVHLDILVAPGAAGTPDAGLLRGHVRDVTEDILRKEVQARKERAEFYVHLLRHDVGNFVTPAISNMELLLLEDGLDPQTKEILAGSMKHLGRVRDLLRAVDALATLDRLDPQPTDIVAAARRAADGYQSAHPGEMDVAFEVPEGPVLVRGVPILDQAFVNLLGNARRHCPAPVKVVIRVTRDKDAVWASVEDNGPGVPASVRAQLFTYGTKGTASSGKGLGLYIVRTIARSLGGDAVMDDRVEGRPELGAAFRLRLVPWKE